MRRIFREIKETILYLTLIAVVVGAAAAYRYFHDNGPGVAILVGTAVSAIFAAYFGTKALLRRQARNRRRNTLVQKYADPKQVNAILARQLWVGQTAEQIVESLGKPELVDRNVMKTKTKEIWKYGHIHSNRYQLKVTLENERVVGWEEKA